MKRSDFNFEIIASGDSHAPLMRAGIIHTPHGDILTPTFNVVGTHAAVKFMSPTDLAGAGAQVMLSNGYHLLRQATMISVSGGLAKYSGWNCPTFTDSGGFQVMSLGSGLGKVISMDRPTDNKSAELPEPDKRLALVDDEGVEFRDPYSGRIIKFTPELSIKTQHQIGADVMMSFDELTNINDTYEYNQRAMERTRRWAIRGLKEHIRQTSLLKNRPYQALYGVIQGAYFLDLRAQAAHDISSIDIDGWGFDGFGIGGALAKSNLADIIRVTNQVLPETKPRHLLGLSRPDDIFIGVENGCDTFDCVAPTREARHGRIYTLDGNYNLKNADFINDQTSLMTDCDCQTCQSNYSKVTLRAMLKSPISDERAKAFNLLSIHNVRFIIRLMEQIRQSIIEGDFHDFRQGWENRYNNY